VKLAPFAVLTAFLFLVFSPIYISEGIAETTFDSDVLILDSGESGLTLQYSAPPVTFTGIDEYPDNYQYPQIANTAQNRIPGQPFYRLK
jgi:hypothetical protein